MCAAGPPKPRVPSLRKRPASSRSSGTLTLMRYLAGQIDPAAPASGTESRRNPLRRRAKSTSSPPSFGTGVNLFRGLGVLAIIRRWWVWILGVVVLGFGARFASRFPWQDTWDTILGANWAMLGLAGAANLLSFAAKAVAWQLLLLGMAPVRLRSALAATFAGAAVNTVSIAVSGEAARMHLVATYDGVPPVAAARSILASRIVEAAALGILLVVLGRSLWPGWYLGA